MPGASPGPCHGGSARRRSPACDSEPCFDASPTAFPNDAPSTAVRRRAADDGRTLGVGVSSPREPFWEAVYREEMGPAFGPPAADVLEVADRLPTGARVLDLGCGDGRHALALAARGLEVEAIDISPAGIDALRSRAGALGVELHTAVADATAWASERPYQLIVAHGLLHLLPRRSGRDLLRRIQRATAGGGWNVIAVFTDRLAPPEDLAAHMAGLFEEGELAGSYPSSAWVVERDRRHTLRDEHPGGVRHAHPVNEIVVRRRAGGMDERV